MKLSSENKVSVIIPTFKDWDRLIKCLRALELQTYPKADFEVIVVNNDPLGVVPNFNVEENVVIIDESKKGSYAARNAGVQIAKGVVLAFTDADCIPQPEWLESGITTLFSSGSSLLAGKVQFYFRKEAPNAWEYIDAAGKMNQKNYVEKYGFAATANLFVRSEMFDKYGLFNEKLQSGGDYEFTRRLVKKGERLVYFQNAIVLHPARSSLSEKLKKTVRVAKGQSQLEKLGLLEQGPLRIRNFLPSIKLQELENYRLSHLSYFAAIFFQYILKLSNGLVRLRLRYFD